MPGIEPKNLFVVPGSPAASTPGTALPVECVSNVSSYVNYTSTDRDLVYEKQINRLKRVDTSFLSDNIVYIPFAVGLRISPIASLSLLNK